MVFLASQDFARSNLIYDLEALRGGKGFTAARLVECECLFTALGGRQPFEVLKARFISAINSLEDKKITETLLVAYALHPEYEEHPLVSQRWTNYAAKVERSAFTVMRWEKQGIEALADQILAGKYSAGKTDNAPNYLTIAKTALAAQNFVDLRLALDKIQNNATVYRLLKQLNENRECIDQERFQTLFHERFSKVDNDKYRFLIFETCLSEGYFCGKANELIPPHFHEFTNNKYIFDTLVLLRNMGFFDLNSVRHIFQTELTYGAGEK
jgi:hypothetical protein